MVAASGRWQRSVSEEEAAATRVVVGLSAAVGGVAGTIGLVGVQPTALLLLPTAALLVAIAARAIVLAGWAGVALWALILPAAHGEAMLGPMLMVVACAAIAVGPERLMRLASRDWHGSPPARPEPRAWIEEVPEPRR